MFDTSAIDSEIAALEKQVARLHNDVMSGPATQKGMDANAAYNLANKRLGGLRERRVNVLAGLPDPRDVEKEPPVTLARPVVRMPYRISEKAGPEGRKTPHIEQPLNGALLDELSALAVKHWEADAAERIEDNIQNVVDLYCNQKANSERLFTQALYAGFIKVIAELDTQIGAIAEFQMNRRRELEARLDALEARPLMKYCGVWAADKAYATGSFVTYDGGLWHANIEVAGVLPGDGKMWTLAVKRGRDSRERNAR